MDEVIEIYQREENYVDLVHLWTVEGARVLALTACILTSRHPEPNQIAFFKCQNQIVKFLNTKIKLSNFKCQNQISKFPPRITCQGSNLAFLPHCEAPF